MKKNILCMFLLFLGSIEIRAEFFEDVGKAFTGGSKSSKKKPSTAQFWEPIGKSVKKEAKGLEKRSKALVQDPGKVLKEDADRMGKDLESVGKDIQQGLESVGKDFLKLVGGGTDIDAIEKAIADMQSSIGTIQPDVAAIISALDAPSSPKTKAPIIAEKLKQFQIQASALMEMMVVPDIKASLSDAQALARTIARLASPTTQSDMQNLYGMYDAILMEIDSIDPKPVLTAIRAVFLDAAKTVDSAREAIISCGKVVEGMVDSSIMNST